MRKYEEMISEFASLKGFNHRQKWFDKLPLEELREFRIGINNGSDWVKSWQPYIDSVISYKITELREGKLDDLGL